jgi:hypothetical protein
MRIYIVVNTLVVANRTRIVTLARASRLPTIFQENDFVQAGGLVGPMVYFRRYDPAPPVRYRTMNTLRPVGVIFTPKPG